MLKLRVKHGDREFEFEGEKAEILEIYNEITRQPSSGVVVSTPSTTRFPTRVNAPRVISQIGLSTDIELMNFILSKPNYRHDIIETQKHFFGSRIPSRVNPILYRKLSQQLQRVRKIIEERKKGKFMEIMVPSKNLKQYFFKPTSVPDHLSI